MFNKSLIAMIGIGFFLGPIIAVADDTKMCNTTQQARCGNFCSAHQGVKSCIIDITKKSGTCSCEDGTMHSKS